MTITFGIIVEYNVWYLLKTVSITINYIATRQIYKMTVVILLISHNLLIQNFHYYQLIITYYSLLSVQIMKYEHTQTNMHQIWITSVSCMK